MTSPDIDVLGIGNAIVDVFARVEDEFLLSRNLTKGMMRLIDEPEAHELYGEMGPSVEISGGSAANTIAGIASFGAKAAYFGKVKADQLGEIFAHDLKAQGVRFDTERAIDGPSTARSLILITPDGERTMNTYLGAAQDLHPNDIDADAITAAQIIYLEGYLWDPPRAKEAFLKAAKIAHAAERDVALTLSDAFCVDRYRLEFLELIRAGTVDLVFANERELHSLYETADFDTALNALRSDARLGVVTRSEKGCLVVTREQTQAIPASPVERLVDATGAGDLFAAGFLTGLSRGTDYRTAARLGAVVAAEVIQHLGARPETSLKALAQDNGFDL